jgi:hypothetical protein
MPQIGELGPGVWLASGFGGHGLNTTAMAGNLIARAIIDGDQTWRQFTPFELVWAGGVFGRAAAQIRIWVRRFRDAVEERRSQARELAYRQSRLPNDATHPETVAAETTPAEAKSNRSIEPAPELTDADGAAPRSGRRRKRTRTSASRAVEHDAEA